MNSWSCLLSPFFFFFILYSFRVHFFQFRFPIFIFRTMRSNECPAWRGRHRNAFLTFFYIFLLFSKCSLVLSLFLLFFFRRRFFCSDVFFFFLTLFCQLVFSPSFAHLSCFFSFLFVFCTFLFLPCFFFVHFFSSFVFFCRMMRPKKCPTGRDRRLTTTRTVRCRESKRERFASPTRR